MGVVAKLVIRKLGSKSNANEQEIKIIQLTIIHIDNNYFRKIIKMHGNIYIYIKSMCHQPLCYFWKTAFRCHTKLIIICVDIITLTKLTLIDMRIYVWTLVYDKQWFLPLAAEMDGIFEMIQILYNIHGYIIFRPLFHQLKFPCRQHSYECSLQCIVYVYRCSWRWMMMMMMIHPNPVMNCKWAFCFFFRFCPDRDIKLMNCLLEKFGIQVQLIFDLYTATFGEMYSGITTMFDDKFD